MTLYLWTGICGSPAILIAIIPFLVGYAFDL